MSLIRISVIYALDTAMDLEMEWTALITSEEMANLVPAASSSPSGIGWAYWDEAEAHVVSGMKRNLFPDETSTVSKALDLKRLGVSKLRVMLRDENGNTNSLSLI